MLIVLILLKYEWLIVGSYLEKHLKECNRVVSTKLRFARQTTTESQTNLYQARKELVELEDILKEVHMSKNITCVNLEKKRHDYKNVARIYKFYKNLYYILDN